jgi:hypothetical protein
MPVCTLGILERGRELGGEGGVPIDVPPLTVFDRLSNIIVLRKDGRLASKLPLCGRTKSGRLKQAELTLPDSSNDFSGLMRSPKLFTRFVRRTPEIASIHCLRDDSVSVHNNTEPKEKQPEETN